MKSVTSLEHIKKIPLRERPYWYIPEQLTAAHPIVECGEELADIAEMFRTKKMQLVIAPAVQDQEKLLLRSSAAQRLLRAAQLLRKQSNGTTVLKITDAFRPLSLQRKYF